MFAALGFWIIFALAGYDLVSLGAPALLFFVSPEALQRFGALAARQQKAALAATSLLTYPVAYVGTSIVGASLMPLVLLSLLSLTMVDTAALRSVLAHVPGGVEAAEKWSTAKRQLREQLQIQLDQSTIDGPYHDDDSTNAALVAQASVESVQDYEIEEQPSHAVKKEE